MRTKQELYQAALRTVTVRKWDIRLDIVDWCLIHQINACHIEHRSILFIKDNTL